MYAANFEKAAILKTRYCLNMQHLFTQPIAWIF